jgi:two-component system KDP operon response regulator KdpE
MSSGATILVVDDEPQIQRFLRHALEAARYGVAFAGDGAAALRLFAASPPDLVILDLGLPDIDGKIVLGQIRQTSAVPVIVLSARDGEDEKVEALDLGANDFVAKPFGIGELLARIRACLRVQRPAPSTDGTLHLAPLTLDPAAHLVTRNGEAIRLTPKEFELLALLMTHPGRVLTHRQILTKVWGPAHVEDVAYLRVFIRQLRQKIEADAGEPTLILTEPGVGYRSKSPT